MRPPLREQVDFKLRKIQRALDALQNEHGHCADYEWVLSRCDYGDRDGSAGVRKGSHTDPTQKAVIAHGDGSRNDPSRKQYAPQVDYSGACERAYRHVDEALTRLQRARRELDRALADQGDTLTEKGSALGAARGISNKEHEEQVARQKARQARGEGYGSS